MAKDTMALQALLRNSIFVFIIATGCQRVQEPVAYTNASSQQVTTKGGITYVEGITYTGVVYELYAGGDTMYSRSYRKGKEDGRTAEWYVNKQLKEERWYQQNHKEGEHKSWFEDGKPKFVYHFHDDVNEGNAKEWFDNGQLFRDFNYKNGQEDGTQRMYWKNGKLRMNYQYVNGRKYGLTGVKSCVSAMGDSTGH